MLGFGHDANFARAARCQNTTPPVVHAAADVKMVRDFSKGRKKAPRRPGCVQRGWAGGGNGGR